MTSSCSLSACFASLFSKNTSVQHASIAVEPPATSQLPKAASYNVATVATQTLETTQPVETPKAAPAGNRRLRHMPRVGTQLMLGSRMLNPVITPSSRTPPSMTVQKSDSTQATPQQTDRQSSSASSEITLEDC